MRGGDARTEALFSYVSCERRVPTDHPLRAVRKIVNEALTALSPEFEKLYTNWDGGRLRRRNCCARCCCRRSIRCARSGN